MFKKLKEKIADGVEGVSPGRQTPLRSSKEEVGRAQAQNNGKIEDSVDSSPSSPKIVNSQNSTPRHITSTVNKIDPGERTPVIEPEGPVFESTPNHSFSVPAPAPSTHNQRHTSTSSNVSMAEERSDVESEMDTTKTDHMSINEIRELYRKQDKTLKRYKKKFSEVVDAYKALHKDKEKLEATLTSGQDKQLRRINELKETIELEQESKRHLEEVLNLNIEEKDEQIHALQTQVQILKTKYGLSSPASDVDMASSAAVVNGTVIGDKTALLALQDQIKQLNDQISKVKKDNEQLHGTIARLDQEKKTAIQEIMTNLQHSLTEQDDLKSEIFMLRDELNKKDITILRMREEEEKMEDNLRLELSKDITNETLEEALKQQEAELKAIFEEKENAVKNTFADKVHDLRRIFEESEKQKEIEIQQKDNEVAKINDQFHNLKGQVEQFAEKEEKFQEKMRSLVAEKEEWIKKHGAVLQEIEKEKVKTTELLQLYDNNLKLSYEDSKEQVAKVKRTMQTKIYELQEQLRKKSQELNETAANLKNELDQKVKEAQQQMQSDHAKASRKLEVKVADMKKMIKELRTQLNEKESKCNELELRLNDVKAETNQYKSYQETSKSLNVSLMESEERLKTLNESLIEKEKSHQSQLDELTALKGENLLANAKIENLNTELQNKNSEILEWRCLYEQLNKKCDSHQIEINSLCDEMKQKCVVEKELREILQDRDISVEKLKQSENNLTTEVSDLQNHLKIKDNLITELHILINDRDNVIRELKNKEHELNTQLELLQSSSSTSQKEQAERFENEMESIRNDFQHRENEIKKNLSSEIESYKVKQEDLEKQLACLLNDLNCERETTQTLHTELSKKLQSAKEMEFKYAETCEQLRTTSVQLKENQSLIDQYQTNALSCKDKEVLLQNELTATQTNLTKLKQESQDLTKKLSNKTSEFETLATSLKNLNNELNLKGEEFERKLLIKDREINSLNKKCEQLKQEKHSTEENLNAKINEMVEDHCSQLSRKDNEYHAELHRKDEECRAEISKLINDKDSSADNMNAKLEELRKQEVADLELRYAAKIKDINTNWNEKIKNMGLKHKEQQNKAAIEYTEKLTEKEKTIEKFLQDLEFLKSNQKELYDTQEAEITNLTLENNHLKTTMKETNDMHIAQIESLKLREKELVEKYSEELQVLRASMISEINSISESHVNEINQYKSKIEAYEQRRTIDFNELCENHKEDRNILLKQLDEVNFNVNELKKLCDNKDEELASLKEKHEIGITNLKEQLSNSEVESLDKLQTLENIWNEKLKNLEKKYKTIISDRDKKSKSFLEDSESKHSELVQKMEADFNLKETNFISEINEKDEQILALKNESNILSDKLTRCTKSFDDEISIYKIREQDAWQQLEQMKQDLAITKESSEKKIVNMESKLLFSKNTIEELQVRIMSRESSSREIDVKLTELLNEKNELEQKINNNEHSYEEKIRHFENQIDEIKQHYEETIRHLTDQHLQKIKEVEKEKEVELKSTYCASEESNRNKLLEMKKKAETKIAKMKKDFSEKTTLMESEITELKEKISSLQGQLEDEMLLYEKQTMGLKEQHEKHMKEQIQNVLSKNDERQSETLSEVMNLRDEVAVLSKQLNKCREQIENMTIDKMDALKSQKVDLQEEYEIEMKKVRDEYQKNIDSIERKLHAKVEEKEFEYSSKIKQMIKEFQLQLGAKDREIQDAVQEANEVAQKDERKLIAEYNEQITELEKELRLRERDLVEYQTAAEQQVNQLKAETDQLIVEHRAEIQQLKNDHNQHAEELMKQHEEVLLNASQKDESTEQTNALERSYELKISNLEERHQQELKKHKLQLNKMKNEMRKLLAEKGVTLLNVDETEPSSAANSNPGSDVEADQSEVQKLKEKVATLVKELKSLREREKVLALQAERSPYSTSPGNRPATLHLDDSLNNSNSPSPKTPQPLEFEYLRNILFNYMMGNQRKQMAKVLTAIVNFPPNQVKQILAKVEEQETATSGRGYFTYGR